MTEFDTGASGDIDAQWPDGVARHVLVTVDSTMAEAARLAPHLSGPAWIMAREQTAGRGRRGRAWHQPAGNLAATVVFRPNMPLAQAALYSFVAALALDQALARVCGPHARLSIKWPNDVMLNGGKIAGILLESAGTTGQGYPANPSHLTIGFGVNLEAAPPVAQVEPGAMTPVSLLGETGQIVAPDDFLTLLAQAFDHWSRQYQTYGFGPIRTAWLARAARLGQSVTARTMRDTTTGLFETIDDSGAMILRTPTGRTAISAADIFF